jgi:hypothetical protein
MVYKSLGISLSFEFKQAIFMEVCVSRETTKVATFSFSGLFQVCCTGSSCPANIMDHNASPFMALADELLIEIISHVEDRISLKSLARVCSRLQRLSELFLYKSVLIRVGDEACDFIKKCKRRKARRHAVHDLQVCWPWEEEDGIEVVNPFLETFTHLRHLKVEGPCCNDLPWSPSRYYHENQPSLVWNNGGRIDIPALFEKALAMPQPKPAILGQLQSCMSLGEIRSICATNLPL